MKYLLALVISFIGILNAHALVISEVLSNPLGTDNGREWVELYNDTSSAVDLSTLSLSTSENGQAVALTPLQGGTTLAPGGYAVIATIVSGQTKFLEDYPSYAGILVRVASTFTLTNTSTSLYVRSGSSVMASMPSYTPADEGKALAFIGGTYVAGTPTPGAENQASSSTVSDNVTTSTTTSAQTTVPQLAPPASDIVLYVVPEKIAVAGAETNFSARSATRDGKEISQVNYTWAFGDGGGSTGSSTTHRYVYGGRYIAVVEGTSPALFGTARMVVRVVPPDIVIETIGVGKYGPYVDIRNAGDYDIDLSQWSLIIDGAGFPFAKNTILPPRVTTRFAGASMGFASTTIQASGSVSIRFPNLEEVTRYVQASTTPVASTMAQATMVPQPKLAVSVPRAQPKVLGVATTALPQTKAATTTQEPQMSPSKDTRLVQWWRNLFGGK
ncbi:MAG: hypothetical protein RIQ41_195 [Candidatus Parcubacteria bacterium]|jgi:hypothetical protein